MGGFMGGADGLDEEGEEDGGNGEEDFMPEIIAVDAPNGDPIYYRRIQDEQFIAYLDMLDMQ